MLSADYIHTNWFACFSLFLMYEAGTKQTAMALPQTILPTAMGQVPHMLVSGNIYFLSHCSADCVKINPKYQQGSWL